MIGNQELGFSSPIFPVEMWIVCGIVENVDLEEGIIRFWIDCISEEQDTPITDEMPDWLLQKGVSFKTKIPRECVRNNNLENVIWDDFELNPYSSLTEDELYDALAELSNFEPL